MTTIYGLPFGPEASFPVTSMYGPRPAPTAGGSTFHWGYDFGTPVGTPIYSPADGTIQYMGADDADLDGDGVPDGLGNYIALTMPGGEAMYYGHLNGFAPDLQVAQAVPAGTLLGYTGSSGISTGPHLDIRMRGPDGSRIDPTPYLFPDGLAGPVDVGPAPGATVPPVAGETAMTGAVLPTAAPATGLAGAGTTPTPFPGATAGQPNMAALAALAGGRQEYPYNWMFDIGQALMMGAADRNPFPGLALGLGQAADRRARYAQQGGNQEIMQRLAYGQAMGLTGPALQEYALTGDISEGSDGLTAQIRNWEYFQSLPPEAQQAAIESGMFGSGAPEININNEPAPPSGWRYVRNEQGQIVNMEPIPGGPAEAEADAAAAESEAADLRLTGQAQQLYDDVNYAIELIHSGSLSTGIGGALTSWIPGTDANALDNVLQTIRSNVGMEEMMAIRAAGGTFGALSDQENANLQSLRGNLDAAQSPAALHYALARYLNYWLDLAYPNGGGPERIPVPSRTGRDPTPGSSDNPAPLPSGGGVPPAAATAPDPHAPPVIPPAAATTPPPTTGAVVERDGVLGIVYPDGRFVPLFR